MESMITDIDKKHLGRCVELAREALSKGNSPFGSVLVSESGEVLYEDHNRNADGDNTQHPEFAIARWAVENMKPEERAKSTVYTSGEHCPMCAAAHGLNGLGRIVYAFSTKQLIALLAELGVTGSRLNPLPIESVVKNAVVKGPVMELAEQISDLHKQYYKSRAM